MNIPARFASLAVFVAVLGHGSAEFVATMPTITGPELSVWRILLGGAGLMVLALLIIGPRALFAPLKTDAWELTWLSVCGMSGAYFSFHIAMETASIIQVATLITTTPIFVGIANLIVNGQRLTAVKIVTSLFAFIGLVFLITDGLLEKLIGGQDSIKGILLALNSSVLGAFFAVRITPLVSRHGVLSVTALSLMTAGIGLWVGVGLIYGIWVAPHTLFERPAADFSWIIVLAFWNTTISQFLWLGGLAASPDITRASYLFYLKPIIAAALAIMILNDQISLLQVFAIIVVTGSVLVELFWPRIIISLARWGDHA